MCLNLFKRLFRWAYFRGGGLIIGGSFALQKWFVFAPENERFVSEHAAPEGICEEIQAQYKECNTTNTIIVRSKLKIILFHNVSYLFLYGT